MNFDDLIAPISDAAPCGDDLSFSIEFDAIQELRRADDPTLDQGEWITSLKSSDWPAAKDQCGELLLKRTKDLRVAAWLTEAEARVNGYAGLADGLTLCRLLCERFWPNLHPQLDDGGDAEQRSGNLRWLLAQTEALAPRLPVLRDGEHVFSLHDIEMTRVHAALVNRAEESTPAAIPPVGAVTPELIAAARKSTTHEFFAANLADARRARQALQQLQQVIDAQLGADGPAFSAAKSALDGVVHAVERLAREAGALGHAEDDPTALAGEHYAAKAADVTATSLGPLRTRHDALRQLRAVADFFRRTEPHSPVAYLADRAAQWVDMPLHIWLRVVLKDSGTLSQIEELLGVYPDARTGA